MIWQSWAHDCAGQQQSANLFGWGSFTLMSLLLSLSTLASYLSDLETLLGIQN